MKYLRVATILIALSASSAVYAQVPPTPEAQALAQKLMAEINSNIQCGAAGITLQQQLAAANAKLKALEDKYEPKKDSPK